MTPDIYVPRPPKSDRNGASWPTHKARDRRRRARRYRKERTRA